MNTNGTEAMLNWIDFNSHSSFAANVYFRKVWMLSKPNKERKVLACNELVRMRVEHGICFLMTDLDMAGASLVEKGVEFERVVM